MRAPGELNFGQRAPARAYFIQRLVSAGSLHRARPLEPLPPSLPAVPPIGSHTFSLPISSGDWESKNTKITFSNTNTRSHLPPSLPTLPPIGSDPSFSLIWRLRNPATGIVPPSPLTNCCTRKEGKKPDNRKRGFAGIAERTRRRGQSEENHNLPFLQAFGNW